MSEIIKLKCPNCGGELTPLSDGGFLCEYCDSRFSSQIDVEEQKGYAREKGKIAAQEEHQKKLEREQQEKIDREQEEEKKRQQEQAVIDAQNAKIKRRNQWIGTGIVLVSAILFIVGKTSDILSLRIIGVVLWFFAGIFAIIVASKASKEKRKSGALWIFILMIVALIVSLIIKGGSADASGNQTTADANIQTEIENAESASSYTDINDFYYSVDMDNLTITINNFKAEARERDTEIVLASQYTLDGTVYNITAIGDDGCFMGESHIESVVIPEGVTYVGANTFNSVAGIKYIYLPSSLQSLDPSFFSYLDDQQITFEYGGSEETFNVITNNSNPQGSPNFTFHFNSELRGGLDDLDRPLTPDDRSDSEKLGGAFADAINGFVNGLNGSGE